MIEYKIIEMDTILKDPNLLATVRSLTLHSYSGMNGALDYLQAIIQSRPVRAHGILAYEGDQPLGWSLVTRESDQMYFKEQEGCACAQVYVKPAWRLKGIGKKLIRMAEELSKDSILSVYAHDNMSFFGRFISQSNFKAI